MKEDNNKLNIKKINDTVNLTNKILKIFYALTIISIIFISILVLRQTKIFNILFTPSLFLHKTSVSLFINSLALDGQIKVPTVPIIDLSL